jgi:hypothetical protein
MCRSIQRLHNVDPPVNSEEVRAAALQFVRKISGTTKPSKANLAAFTRAVEEITAASVSLLDELVSPAPPKERVVVSTRASSRVTVDA